MKNVFLSVLLIAFGALQLSAQSFELLDESNNPIGSEYLFEESGPNLSLTKVHVRNSSSATKAFKATAYHLENTTSVDLQICFAGGCFVIAGNTDSVNAFTPNAAESVDGGQIFDNLKIGPFSGAWNLDDSAIWVIRLFDELDSTDFTEVTLKWKAAEGGGSQTSLEQVKSSQSLRVFPNPTTDQLLFEGFSQDASIEVVNLEGKLVLQQAMQSAIDVDYLNRGIYVLRVLQEGNIQLQEKIILE